MHENPRTLRDYWSIADRPAISLEEIREIVDARESTPTGTSSSRYTGRMIRALTFAGITLVVISVVAIAVVDDSPDTGSSASTPSVHVTRSSTGGSDSGLGSRLSNRGLSADPSNRGPSGGSSPHPSGGDVTVDRAPSPSGTPMRRRSSQTPPVAPAGSNQPGDDGRAIELSVEELARIGVQATDSGVVQFFWQYLSRPPLTPEATMDGDSPIADVWSADARVGKVLRGDIGPDTVETFIKMDVDPSARVQYPTLGPTLVTSSTGRFLPMYYRLDLMMSGKGSMSDSDMAAFSHTRNASSLKQLEDSASLDRLIPVRARGGGRDVVIWYSAQPRFLALLPRRVQVRLRQEIASRPVPRGIDEQSEWTRRWMAGTLSALDSLLSAGRDNAGGSASETGSCYFAACATVSGALEMLGPVPSVVQTTGHVLVRSEVARRLTFALHSFDGRELRILASGVEAGSGETRQLVRFDGVEAGMYLIVVTSDAGERVSARVVVR